MSNSKTLLFVCYDFPPNRDIGGRRTAKFAKALAKKGHQIHVIKADPIEGQTLDSLWSKDVEDPKIKIYSLPRHYPQIVSHPKSGLLNSLLYRFHYKNLLRKHNGSVYDHSLNWENELKKKSTELIQQFNIKNVFISGPPFNLFYYGAKMKERNPDLNVMVDYRDPWVTGVIFGFTSLSPERMKFEKEKQQFVFEKVDHVVTTEISLVNEIRDSSLNKELITANFTNVTHFFDEDEQISRDENSINKDKVSLVYGGNLYPKLRPNLEKFRDYLTELKKTDSETYHSFNLEIHTQERQYDSFFDDHKEVVQLKGLIPNHEMKKKLANSSGTLILLAQDNRHFRTTKFFEALPFEIPIIFMGVHGEVSKFISDKKLGYVIDDFNVDFTKAIKEIKAGKFERGDFDYKDFSLNKVVNKLEALFV